MRQLKRKSYGTLKVDARTSEGLKISDPLKVLDIFKTPGLAIDVDLDFWSCVLCHGCTSLKSASKEYREELRKAYDEYETLKTVDS